MINPTSKLPDVPTSIFTTMSELATETNALNLSQGFPDFPIDEKLVELVSKNMRDGMNQYAPMSGVIQLREAISSKIQTLYKTNYSPETEITITAGATQAIFTIITAFVNKGDEVIVFTPAYDCYAPTIELQGGVTKSIELKSPDYAIDWSQVKENISNKTRMIIINTPHNPTGRILTKEDLNQLEQLTEGTNILVLSDEVYEHIIFDQQSHESICKYPALVNRSLAVFSFGKTFHVTGWKLGYCVAPKYLMDEFRKVHQFNVFCCNHPMQNAIASYLEDEENYISLGKFYQRKRDIFLEAVAPSRFTPIACHGTYFQLLSYKGITDEKDTEFAIRLAKEFKIATIPISVFYDTPLHENVLRVCFAKGEETLRKAGKVLCKV